MADNGENIGGVNISITGDYSPLVSAFSAAQDKAQQAGADIADALVSGAAGAGNVGDEIAGQLDQIGPAADGAGNSLEGFAGDAHDAGEAAGEGASQLAEMAEQMAAVGEALVITEGLRELGTEALGAADSITHASIALTTITGSGTQAEETIKGLEELGMADGLAMPSLLSAATRMQAILGPSADVVSELGQVANGAAVMGTDIETAATKFDQMATAGTASARTLTSLGISLGSLATALNVVIPGSDATAASVAAMFKALDQSQRIDVLNQALSTLGGTAQTVAEQTFGGQWQQLANAWEGIMVQVGQAILPVISDLLEFTKTDVVPFVQGLVSAFTELPQPLKDTAVAVGLAGAAIIPLTGGLAALGLAFSGLEGLLPAVTGLMETFGVTSAEVATEETAAAVATESMGVAAEAAEAGVSALAGVVGGVLVVGLVAAVASLTDLSARLKSAQAAYEGVSQTDFNAWLQSGIAGLKTAAISTEDLEAQQAKLKQALDLGVISAQQYATAISAIDAAMKRVSAEDLASAVSQYSAGLTILKDNTTKATDQQTLLNAVLVDAKTKFDQAAAGYQAGTTTAQQYLQAQNAVTSAQTALQAAMGPLPGSMEAIDAAATKLATSTGFVVSAQQEQANETAVAKSSLDLANVSYDTSVAKLDLLKAQLDDANAAYTAGLAPRSAVIAAEQNLQKAYADSQKESQALDTTVANYASTMGTQVVAGQKLALAGLQDLAAGLGPAESSLLGLDSAITGLQSVMPNFGVLMTGLSTGPLVGLQSALDEAKAKVAALAQAMQDGAAVGQQYEKSLKQQLDAQVALDQETAVLALGLQGATDAYSLARDAVAAAQAKVDDLTSAFQNGLATYAQVQSAQKALASAQAELTAAQNAGTTAANSLTTANQGLASSAPAAAAGLNAIASAAQNAATQVGSVTSMVDGLDAALEKGIQVAANTSGIMYTQNGVTTAQGLAAMLDASNYLYNADAPPTLSSAQVSANTAARTAAEKAAYDKGYTPAAIAKAEGQPIATVIADLGLTAGQANMTRSQASGGTAGASSSSGSSGSGTAPQPLNTTYSGSSSSTSLPTTGATEAGGVGTLTDPVAAAQAVVAALNALSGGRATSALAEQIDQLEDIVINGGGLLTSQASQLQSLLNQAGLTASGTWASGSSTSGTTGTTSSSTVPVTAASGSGTSAVDGGSYPAVTAHQASGEVWNVTGGGTVSAGSAAASVITTTVQSTINQTGGGVSTAATQAVGSAALQIATNSAALGPISSSLANTAASTQQIATAVAGLLQRISTSGGGTSSGGLATVATGSGIAYGGTPTATVGGGNPQGATVPGYNLPPTSTPIANIPGFNPFGPTSTGSGTSVTVNVDARGAIGLNSQQLQSQISSMASQALVAQLFTSGARLTR